MDRLLRDVDFAVRLRTVNAALTAWSRAVDLQRGLAGAGCALGVGAILAVGEAFLGADPWKLWAAYVMHSCAIAMGVIAVGLRFARGRADRLRARYVELRSTMLGDDSPLGGPAVGGDVRTSDVAVVIDAGKAANDPR